MKLKETDLGLIKRLRARDESVLHDLFNVTLPQAKLMSSHKNLKRFLQDALLKIRDDVRNRSLDTGEHPSLQAYALHLVLERIKKEEKDREVEAKIYKSLFEGGSDGWVFYYMQVHYFPSITFYVQKNGGTAEEAKDVIMDGIEALLLNVRNGRYKPRGNARLRTYFFQICKNKWLDQLEKRKRTKPQSLFGDLDLDQFEGDYYLEYDYELLNERQQTVVELFQESSEKCQQVLGMYYYDQLSHEEIAERMGYSGADSSKTQKNKCLRKLKKSLLVRLGLEDKGEGDDSAEDES